MAEETTYDTAGGWYMAEFRSSKDDEPVRVLGAHAADHTQAAESRTLSDGTVKEYSTNTVTSYNRQLEAKEGGRPSGRVVLVASPVGFYCEKCGKKSVDLMHVVSKGDFFYCPKDMKQLVRIPNE
jgi:hypothetical protein